MVLKYSGLKEKEYKKKISVALNLVGMSGTENNIVSTLSGGEQQRISIARAILKLCDLILADQPTASLDQENRDLIFELLRKVNQQGKTIIMVTHDSELASRVPRIIDI